jgi:hypothetical protein
MEDSQSAIETENSFDSRNECEATTTSDSICDDEYDIADEIRSSPDKRKILDLENSLDGPIKLDNESGDEIEFGCDFVAKPDCLNNFESMQTLDCEKEFDKLRLEESATKDDCDSECEIEYGMESEASTDMARSEE